MNFCEIEELRYSQFPDKEEENQIWKENERGQSQAGEQAQNLTMVQDPIAEFDAISWTGVEDFTLSDDAFAFLPEFGSFSSPSSLMSHTSVMHPPKAVLTNTLATSPFLHAPNFVPESLPWCSSEMIMQPQASNPNMGAETQLGTDIYGNVDFSNLSVPCGSSDVLLDDVPMVAELGACTDQLFNLDLPCPGFGAANNISAIEREEKEEGDDLAKFFLEWLKENRDAISLEDLRSICLKKSTIECAARQLSTGPQGRLNLVKLILQWVQDHHLKNKRQKLQQDQSSFNAWLNTSNLVQPELQQIQFGPTWINPLSHQDHDTASIPSATSEARKKRMARKRRVSLLQNRRAAGQSGEPVQSVLVGQGNDYTRNWAFWPALAACAEQGMEMVDLSLLFGGSSSQMNQTMHGSCQHESGTSQPGASATVRQQGLMLHEKNMEFLLQKVLKKSDVGCLGRIVLPKKDAEFHLPELESGDGIIIPVEDIRTSLVWDMRYKFWPNNKSRMYVLENTGGFIRSNGLEEGDIVIIYFEVNSGKYMIEGVKQGGTREMRKSEEREVSIQR